MDKWHNSSGRQLSDLDWLTAHHKAKLKERRAFVLRLLQNKPKKIVDLGCGPGLWLSLFDELAPQNCELVGLDADVSTIVDAERISRNWNRTPTFVQMDIDSEEANLPEADLYLAFNIFPYLDSPQKLLEKIRRSMSPSGRFIVRQYDGGTMRMGPMKQNIRQDIDNSLYASVSGSSVFRHYDMDRIFKIIQHSSFYKKEIYFELFQKISPFDDYFLSYLENTIKWTSDRVSEYSSDNLDAWHSTSVGMHQKNRSYFIEVDLVAEMS